MSYLINLNIIIIFVEKIILIDKPKNWTSNDVVQKIKHTCKFKKVGHAGTLDPNATGLLILAYDEDTKKLNDLLIETKQYECWVCFGIETNTGDVTGQIIYQDNTKIKKRKLIKAIKNLSNNSYYQTPHKFSAIKINGKKAYEYARQNKEIKIEPKLVKLNNFKIINFDKKEKILHIIIDVSKGFYVRSFCKDIADQLKTHATLNNLRRLKCGNYKIEDALKIEDFITKWKSNITTCN